MTLSQPLYPLPNQANSTCYNPGNCSLGVCSASTPKPYGSSCNDGNPKTVNVRKWTATLLFVQLTIFFLFIALLLQDICIEDNVCQGQDLCANVTCASYGQCYQSSTCDYSSGNCTVPATKPNGTTCDDHNNRTTNDQVTANHLVSVFYLYFTWL